MKNLNKLIHECIHASINNILKENADGNNIDSIMSKYIKDAQFALNALQALNRMFNEAYNQVNDTFSRLMESYGYKVVNIDIENDFGDIIIKFITNLPMESLEADENYDNLYYPIMSSVHRLKQEVESRIGSDFCYLIDSDINDMFIAELTLTINEDRIYPNRD